MPEGNDQSIEDMFKVKVDNNIPDGEIHLVNALGELKGKIVNVGCSSTGVEQPKIESTLSYQRLMNEIVTLDLTWNCFISPFQYDLSVFTPENFTAFCKTPSEIWKRFKQLPEYLQTQAKGYISEPMRLLVEQVDKLGEGWELKKDE